MADPIQPQFHKAMNDLAHELDDRFNGPALPGVPRKPKYGFALLLFEFGKADDGRVNYISNGEREDMLAAMREWLARAEGRVPTLPTGARQ